MIKLKNIYKKFKYQKLFDDLNLEIPKNKLTFIVGKSGSGKSTLLNLIAGIDKPDKGKIIFEANSKPLVDLIFQEFNLIQNLSVKNNIKIGNHIKGDDFSSTEFEQDIKNLDLKNEIQKEKTKNISGGEKQRVAILRAITRKSSIILADEPTGNLDTTNSENIFNILKKESLSKTVVVVSHDLESAKKYADRIIYLADGKIEKTEINDRSDKTITTKEETIPYDKPSKNK